METAVVKTQDGKDYNRFGEEVIPCAGCGAPTTMTGTKLCDGCHSAVHFLALPHWVQDNLRRYKAAR